MTTQELTTAIFQRLKKVRFIIITVAVAAAVAMVLYAKQKPVTYTSRSSVFPLTSGNDNNRNFICLKCIIGHGEY